MATTLEVMSMVQTAQGGSFQDADSIFMMMPCIGFCMLGVSKSYKAVVYRPVYENLYTELRAIWPDGEVTEEEYHIINTALARLYIVIKGYYWCNNTLLVVYLSVPFIRYIKWLAGWDVSLVLPFFYWLPFNPYYMKGVYEFLLLVQTWHGVITVWYIVSSDLLFCAFMCHITTQLDLLSVKIRRLVYVPEDEQLIGEYPLATYNKELSSTDKRSLNDDESQKKVHDDLIDIVLRHRVLIRLAGDVEQLFSVTLLLNFCNGSINICFCGFCCVMVEKWNELPYKVFLLTALSQMWLFCWYGQRLLDSSLGVADALYNSGWYRVNKQISNIIRIMIYRSQKEVRVTTYGFSVISLSSFTTIIKTAWSYFTLLLKTYKQ
ncbi:odorant receptor 4-like [Pectinophora gossypiella]|uniref:odorant receptor 4-like n=1 Tax=Pectinophora gossypiella TaxID=13191 RepID=UPI00214E01F3|nr:odorant receptor 4-like [Pectinophora gossypiella]